MLCLHTYFLRCGLFSSLNFGQVATDWPKVMHMSPSCIWTGGLKYSNPVCNFCRQKLAALPCVINTFSNLNNENKNKKMKQWKLKKAPSGRCLFLKNENRTEARSSIQEAEDTTTNLSDIAGLEKQCLRCIEAIWGLMVGVSGRPKVEGIYSSWALFGTTFRGASLFLLFRFSESQSNAVYFATTRALTVQSQENGCMDNMYGSSCMFSDTLSLSGFLPQWDTLFN